MMSSFRMMKLHKTLSVLAFAVLLSGAGVMPAVAADASSATQAPSAKAVDSKDGYKLGVGDKVSVTVYGEADLSGEYAVGSTGSVALPLIGEVQALNQTLAAFEKAIAAKLSEGYLQSPRVSVQVTNYRPFFILGEVSKPGSYPYVNGMTILNAVALAGGYTYRGDKGDLRITRADDPEKKEVTGVAEDTSVRPGDVIRVPERFF